MEVHWNTHREWWRGVLVFRYRSKVCKKLKAITPFCFAVRHEIPMTSHERSTFRERLSEPTTVQPLAGLVVVGGGCFVASRFDGLLPRNPFENGPFQALFDLCWTPEVARGSRGF